MKYLPKQMAIEIYTVSMNQCSLKLNKKKLIYRRFPERSISSPKDKKILSPTKEQWYKFWQDLDKLKVWEWEKGYYDNKWIDGTDWKVNIFFDKEKKIISGGSNNFPKGFKKFLKAVRKLIGRLEFE
jgi:hypothetical protein